MKKNFKESFWAGFYFLFAASLIVVVFNPWNPMLGLVQDYLGRIAMISALLILTLLRSGSIGNNRQLRSIWLGLFILATTMSVDWFISVYLIDSAGIDNDNVTGLALLKLNECMIVCFTIIFLSFASGEKLDSICLAGMGKGKTVVTGIILFLLSASITFFASPLLFKSGRLDPMLIISWSPWLLMFVLANGFMEELMFRGLFLKKLEPAMGKLGSNILVAVVFSGAHFVTSYSSDRYIFVAILFPLALAWGYLTQRTGNILVSSLFHAGMDVPVMTGIFAVMSNGT